MIIDNELISFIKTKLIKTANLLGIENVIIEKDKIRGMDEKQTTILLHEHGLTIPFQSMGLTRLSLLNSRLSLSADMTVNAVEDEKVPGVISRIDIKAKKFKVDFRTANPNTIKAPKGLKSAGETLYTVVFTDEDLDLLVKAASSMPQRTETGSVCLMSKPNEKRITIVLTDTNSDDFEMEIEGDKQFTTQDNLVINYPLKQFLTMVKNNNKMLTICERNLLKTTVNDISVIMLPIL